MQDLPFETLTQFVALGLTLVAGWFLGLASAPGGRKWRERYYDEELSNAGYRDRSETDLREANRRIRDLEAENARLRADAPIVAPAVEAEPVREGHSNAALAGAAIAGATAGAVAVHAAHEHQEEPARSEPVAADHAEPAIANGSHADAEHAKIAHESHGDAQPAPSDTHHH
ncbi:MAG: hypothetical protein EOP60_09905 [Sphingomonadales bacterium]|nr:MAG: hypothetical protein EOP60_09905 [Sphingomonadales bacterium]